MHFVSCNLRTFDRTWFAAEEFLLWLVNCSVTTLLVPPSILEWSNTGVDENLADRLLCFLKLQPLLVGLLIEKDPLQ